VLEQVLVEGVEQDVREIIDVEEPVALCDEPRASSLGGLAR
jgi:hypothetical protein